jgi:hypothetical protein
MPHGSERKTETGPFGFQQGDSSTVPDHVNGINIAASAARTDESKAMADLAEKGLSSQKAAVARQVAEAYLAASRGRAGPGRAFEVAVQIYCRLETEITPAEAARAVAAILATYDRGGLI